MPSEKTLSKRQELRQKRARQQRTQRLMVVLILLGAALIIIGLAVAPAIRNALTPVGEIKPVALHDHFKPNGLSLGDPNAPVKIDLYEDFQCSACDQYTTSTEEQVLKNYVDTGKAYYTFHNYIIIDQAVGGSESDHAANAALCANDQSKFWEYHDMLFTNWNGEGTGAFSDKRLVAFAQALNLNMSSFNSCFNAKAHENEIQADIAKGQQLGITGTPSIFVNGKEVKPGYIPTYDDMKAAIDAALAGK